MLLCKAEEVGKEVKLVDPKSTTQMCSSCHNLVLPKLARSERIYNCSFCGYSEDRDVNAAKNILWKATTESGTDLVKQAHAV